MVQLAVRSEPPSHGGSRLGRSAKIQRNYAEAHQRYMFKYFWPVDLNRSNTAQCGPQQNEETFERRFRMPRQIFDRACTTSIAHSAYLRKGLKPDCTGRMGITPILKVICTLWQLSYGICADLSDDLFEVSETTAKPLPWQILHFCECRAEWNISPRANHSGHRKDRTRVSTRGIPILYWLSGLQWLEVEELPEGYSRYYEGQGRETNCENGSDMLTWSLDLGVPVWSSGINEWLEHPGS